MKKFILILLLIATCIVAWKSYPENRSGIEPLYEEPYVIVYGRPGCRFCQQTLRGLNGNGIEYMFEHVDDPEVKDELEPRMRLSGINTSSYVLPVVDVNGKLFVRPEMDVVLRVYNN